MLDRIEDAAQAVLADARRALEVHGWDPALEPGHGLSVSAAVERVSPMDGQSWRVALAELAKRTGLATCDELGVLELERAIEAWEHAPDRSLADVLRVLS